MIAQDPSISAISATMYAMEDTLLLATYLISTRSYFLYHLQTTLQTSADAYLARVSFWNTLIRFQIE